MPNTPYSNAVNRSLSDKLGEMPSVKDFVSIQAAIDNAVADGSYTLFVPWGSYTFATTLTIPSGFSLVALGQGDRWRSAKQHCRFVYTGSGAAITVAPAAGTGRTSISIVGIEVDCSGATAGTDGLLFDASAAGVTYIENVLVERCTFKDCGHAIHAHGTVFDVTLRRVSAVDCTDDLIYVDGADAGAGSPSQWRIDDCWLVLSVAGQRGFRCVNNSLAGLSFIGGTIAVGDYVECVGIEARGHLNVFGTNLEGLSRYTDPSLDAGTDTFTSAAHGWANGLKVQISTAQTMPSGFSANTDYYVVNKTDNTYQLSLTVGGSAVDITSIGSGVRVSTLPDSVGIRYSGSLGGTFAGKCISWGVGIQVGDPASKADNATNFEIHPVEANNGWDVQLVDGGMRSQTKIIATGAGATYLNNLRLDTDGENGDLVRFDGHVDLGDYNLTTGGSGLFYQVGINAPLPAYFLDVCGAFAGVETGIMAGVGGKVVVGKSSADPDDDLGKVILLSMTGRKLELDTLTDPANIYGAKISNSYGVLVVDPKTVLSIPALKAIGIGTLEGDQPLHIYRYPNPRICLEEGIDGVGSAFAGIGAARDGSSGRKGKLIFYTNNGDSLTDNSTVAGYIDSDGFYHLGNDTARIIFSASSPHTVLGGPTGSLCLVANGTLYVKTATDATSWRAIGGLALEVESLTANDPDGATFIISKAGRAQSTTNLIEAQDSGGTPRFGANKQGDIFCRRANIDGATTITNDGTSVVLLVESNAGADLVEVDNAGNVGIAGDLTLLGDKCNMNDVTGGSKIVATQADGDFEGISGATTASQALVASVSESSASSAIPAAINTTGWSGKDLTVATKLNDLIAALGAGDTVLKGITVDGITITTDRGVITAITP